MGYIVITGASSGIGAAAAIELTHLGHQVLATGRSEPKLEAVHQRMIAAAPAGSTVPAPVPADISDLKQVGCLADVIAGQCPRLDALVNNAAVQPSRRTVSADGFELALAVNHLAPFLLTCMLAGLLRASGGRVVTTSSSTHAAGRIDFDDLQLQRRWTGRRAYARSKLANILFTVECAARIGLPASSFHPGSVRTDLNRDSRFVRVVKPFEKFLLAAPEKGADTLVWLATSGEGAAPSAHYYAARAPRRASAAARDWELATRLWDVSAELVGPVRGD